MTRRILICVTGLSPQIVTETLYALAVQTVPAWIPDEIRLVTTTRGAANARLNLLAESPGWFHRLCRDYALPAIDFGESNVLVVRREDGSELDDIRDDTDNRLAADFIAEAVRALSADPDTEIHASIAGGRKTLGFYLGYAMSLFGRAQDRLSHVLVSSPFESHRDFYYPSRETRVIHAGARGEETLDCRNARVWLGDIPFVRLRDGLPAELLAGGARFSEAVAEAQRAVSPPALTLVPARREVQAAGKSLVLSPIHFAWYWLLAERRKNGLPGLHWSEPECAPALLAQYARLVGPNSADYERAEASYRHFDKSNAEPLKSHVNSSLAGRLGALRAHPYQLALQDTLSGTRYRRVGIDLPGSAIHIETA